MTSLEKLMFHFKGRVSMVAKVLGTDRANVYSWKDRGAIPPSWAREIELVTDGNVTALEILDDYIAKYPPAKWVK